MRIEIQFEEQAPGEWMAEAPELPGVVAFGHTKRTACVNALALTLRVLADLVEAGEISDRRYSVSLASRW